MEPTKPVPPSTRILPFLAEEDEACEAEEAILGQEEENMREAAAGAELVKAVAPLTIVIVAITVMIRLSIALDVRAERCKHSAPALPYLDYIKLAAFILLRQDI